MADGPIPYEATIATICEAFTISPAEAVEQSELFTWRVMEAIAASRVVRRVRSSSKLSKPENELFAKILDELDDEQIKQGIPEEFGWSQDGAAAEQK